jgi:hypothetical protein
LHFIGIFFAEKYGGYQQSRKHRRFWADAKDVGVEEKMTYAEFQKLLLLADSMVASCAPKKAEYGRGYHMGIQIHFNNAQPGSVPDQYSIAEIARVSGCRNVDAFARGYHDGCMGLKPEYIG